MKHTSYMRVNGVIFSLFLMVNMVLAQLFSPSRSVASAVASAYAVLEKASRRFELDNCGIINVVTDGLASYPPAFQLLASKTKGQFQHCIPDSAELRTVKSLD